MGVWGVRQRWELDIRGGGIDWEERKEGRGRERSGEVHGCEEEEEEGGLEDHSKKPRRVNTEWRGSERGKQKERRTREGEHVVKDGWRGGLASEGQKKKKKRGKRRERKEHMDTGSLSLSIHMPSHQMVVCVHTPEMSQPNTPRSLSNHCYRQ